MGRHTTGWHVCMKYWSWSVCYILIFSYKSIDFLEVKLLAIHENIQVKSQSLICFKRKFNGPKFEFSMITVETKL